MQACPSTVTPSCANVHEGMSHDRNSMRVCHESLIASDTSNKIGEEARPIDTQIGMQAPSVSQQ